MQKISWIKKVSTEGANSSPAIVDNNLKNYYSSAPTDHVDFKYDTCDGQILRYCSNSYTDKDTWHSYFPVYQTLFEPIRYTATRILEIGVREGGSISLWNTYFTNAEIHGVDITLNELVFEFDKERVFLYEEDAYSDTFVSKLEVESFDVIIDDGPHTLESMKSVVKLYANLLKPNGMLIIEDVAYIDWVPEILNEIPTELLRCHSVYDRRLVKNRYDDIQIVLRRK